jgi:hypothetical protein
VSILTSYFLPWEGAVDTAVAGLGGVETGAVCAVSGGEGLESECQSVGGL